MLPMHAVDWRDECIKNENFHHFANCMQLKYMCSIKLDVFQMCAMNSCIFYGQQHDFEMSKIQMDGKNVVERQEVFAAKKNGLRF